MAKYRYLKKKNICHMNVKQLLSVFILMGTLISCGQAGKNNANQEMAANDTVSTTQPVIENDTTAIAYTRYLTLKNALVASNADQAKKAGKALSETLQNIDGCENTSRLALDISNSSDIKKQRKDFTTLSADLIALMKHTEISSGSVFVQYCPMANDGDGGYWLASDKEIRNPYYGNEMLNCGEVKEELN